MKSLHIVCATSLAGGQEAFETLGHVTMIPEQDIDAASILGADILVTRSKVHVNDALLEGSSLQFYGTATAGFDHVDAGALDRRGIAWSQAPGSNANSVAEYVIASLCRLARKRDIDWSGMTMGIIGAGHVGSRLAELARAFGLRVLLNDPPLQEQTGAPSYRPLNEVLAGADIVTLHVPLTDEGTHATRGMVDSKFLSATKPGTIFINASRGEVVQENDLLAAFGEGRLSALILDVFDHEPGIRSEVMDAAFIATPHIAGYSLDGRLKGTEMVYLAACRHFGIDPSWRVKTGDGHDFIDVQGNQSPAAMIQELVLNAYDPTLDDQRLRDRPDDTPMAAHFQQLRRNYPERREFSHYTVRCGTAHANLAATLVALGFNVSST